MDPTASRARPSLPEYLEETLEDIQRQLRFQQTSLAMHATKICKMEEDAVKDREDVRDTIKKVNEN